MKNLLKAEDNLEKLKIFWFFIRNNIWNLNQIPLNNKNVYLHNK